MTLDTLGFTYAATLTLDGIINYVKTGEIKFRAEILVTKKTEIHLVCFIVNVRRYKINVTPIEY